MILGVLTTLAAGASESAEQDTKVCVASRKYWNDATQSCETGCESGFIRIEGDRIRCAECDRDTQFAGEENDDGYRTCEDSCAQKAFGYIAVNGREYRECRDKDACDSPVEEDVTLREGTDVYAHCADSYPRNRLEYTWEEEDQGCEKMSENAIWTGSECVQCVKLYPTRPAKLNGTCVTCEEAHPDRPYWNFTTCVAKSSRGTYHVVGVVLIEAALVLISVHKFLVFKRGAPELSARKWAMVALAFLCVAGVVALISVVAFVDIGDKTL